jgi:hypothetical protein
VPNDDDTFLNSHFAAYRNELIADVTPAGPHAVRTTVRRRRRVAVTAGTALAIALIAGPAAGYAALSRGPAPPAPGTTSEPTISASPSPSTATSSPSPSATTPAAPDGHIARRELLNTRVTLPDWWGDAPCNVNARLNAQAPAEEGNWLDSIGYVDVDRDGAEETVALVGCKFNSKVIQKQVVVFDRNGGGGIVTMGQVLTSRPLGWIFRVDPQSDGSIRIEVGDLEPTNEQVAALVIRQWRTYGWTGDTFRQTAGPTSFPVNPKLADLRVTAKDVVFADRNGALTVEVRNAGPARTDYALLTIRIYDKFIEATGDGWSACKETARKTDVESIELSCLLGPMKAGEKKTLTLGLVDIETRTGPPYKVTGHAQIVRLDANRVPLPDPKEADNEDPFEMLV